MATKRSLQQTPRKPPSTPSNSLRKILREYTEDSPMLNSPFKHPESKAGNEEGLRMLESFFSSGSSQTGEQLKSPTSVKTSATKQPTPPTSPLTNHDQVFDNIVAGRLVEHPMDEPAAKKQKLSTPSMTDCERLHVNAGLQMSPLNDNPERVSWAINAVYELEKLVDTNLLAAWEQMALFRRVATTFNAELNLDNDFEGHKNAMQALIPKLITHYPMPHDVEAQITAALTRIQEARTKLEQYIDSCARDVTRLLEEAVYPDEQDKHLSFWYTTVGDNHDYTSLHKLLIAYQGCLTKSATFKTLTEAKGIVAAHERLKTGIARNHQLCLSMPGDIIAKHGITGAVPAKGYKHDDVQVHLNNYNKLFKKTTRELVRAVTFLRNFILVNEGAQARFHVSFPAQSISSDISLVDIGIAYGTPLVFAGETQATSNRHLQDMKRILDTQALALAHADELESDLEDEQMKDVEADVDVDTDGADMSEARPAMQLPAQEEANANDLHPIIAPHNEQVQAVVNEAEQMIGGIENQAPVEEAVVKEPATKAKGKRKIKIRIKTKSKSQKAVVKAPAELPSAMPAELPSAIAAVKPVKGAKRVGKRELDGLVMVDHFENEPQGPRRPQVIVPAKKAAVPKYKQVPAAKTAKQG